MTEGRSVNEIELRLEIEEINLILEALGQQPFARVFELVAKIQQQASEQLEAANGSGTAAVSGSGPDDG